MSKKRKVTLRDIKEHISCHLCKSVLVEPTTITECLHTFCKTCIVKHLNDSNNTCPKCNTVIHQSHPLQHISFDRTIQVLIYRLIPSLEPKDSDTNNNIGASINTDNKDKDGGNKLKPIDTNGQQTQGKTQSYNDYHRGDEQINLYVTPHSNCNLPSLTSKYLRLSSLGTVTHLKKYLALKLFGNQARHKEIDLYCNDNLLGKDHNFKFISVTEWREKVPPVKVTYKPSLEEHE